MRKATEANVADTTAPPRLIRICTDDWPERDRVAMFRENVGRDRVRVEPLDDDAFRIDGKMMKVSGLGLVSVRRSSLRSDFADGSDRLMVNFGVEALATQSGREVVLERGDAVVLTGADVGSFTTLRTARLATVEFPDGGLTALLRDPGLSSARRISARTPSLLLLRHYLNAVWRSDALGSSRLRSVAIAHIHDLAALAVGASREAKEVANSRGVGAARREAIKSDILARLETELTLGDLAARHGLSPRYLRMLFEGEGTSFTEFVRDERLKRAHRMLLSPSFPNRLISDIAYGVGFNDLSYFNRSFRRRFCCSPREVRGRGWPESASG
jgi:AraC-like DNA-binding protein